MSSKKTVDVYDEEFMMNLEIVKHLISRLSNPNDKAICKKWIAKLCTLKTTDVVVKRNRNSFFKYFMQILHKGARGPDAHISYLQINERYDERSRDFMSRWSADKRTYVAAKPLPGKGTLVYMAVSKDPSFGWDLNGVTAYI